MKTTSLLTYGERRRIYQVQRKLGIKPDRLAHVRQTAVNFQKMRQGKKGAFWAAMLPENRRYEDRRTYLTQIEWLIGSLNILDQEQMCSLEAGVRLHDIGYANSSGGDHPEAGYQILTKGDEIWSQLSLSPPAGRAMISQIIKYHGLFVDIGYLFPPEIIASFSPEEKTYLMIMNALDNTAKVKAGGFHSMVFSRMLKRFKDFTAGEGLFPPEERIQQLFGPMHFTWLTEKDLTVLDKSLEAEGIKQTRGFDLLMAKTYFHCWPLLKDLITPDICFSTSYYTPLNPDYAPHFARFLSVLAQVIEQLNPSSDIFIDTAFNYFDFKNRPPFLCRLRENLMSGNLDVVQDDEVNFHCHDLRLKVTGDQNSLIQIHDF